MTVSSCDTGMRSKQQAASSKQFYRYGRPTSLAQKVGKWLLCSYVLAVMGLGKEISVKIMKTQTIYTK